MCKHNNAIIKNTRDEERVEHKDREREREKPGNNSTDISGSESGMQMLLRIRVSGECHCFFNLFSNV